MAIEDALGYPPLAHDGTAGPGIFDHGPDEVCFGRSYKNPDGLLLVPEGGEPVIENEWEGEIEGVAVIRMLCTGCGKSWYERKDG